MQSSTQPVLRHSGLLALTATLVLGASQPIWAAAQDNAAQSTAPPKIDPKATEILHAACDTLSNAKTVSFTAVDTYQRAALTGQPLYYTVQSNVVLQRPDKLRVIKTGDGVPDEFYYDGKVMAAYVPSADLVAISDAPATIDEMLDAAWDVGAIYFPFADVMVSKPCEVIDKNLLSAFYVGRSVVVGGTTTDMVAIAGDNLQAELWIGVSDHLPRMVRVNYTDEPAHAQYQTDYSDWKIGAPVDTTVFGSPRIATAKRMTFEPPTGRPPSELPEVQRSETKP